MQSYTAIRRAMLTVARCFSGTSDDDKAAYELMVKAYLGMKDGDKSGWIDFLIFINAESELFIECEHF